jgi:hypothetical protein
MSSASMGSPSCSKTFTAAFSTASFLTRVWPNYIRRLAVA